MLKICAVLRATFVSAVVVAKSAVVTAEFVVVVIAAIQATADRLHRSELEKFMEIALAWHWQLHLEIVVGAVTVGMAGDKGALHKKGLINAGVAGLGAGLYLFLLLGACCFAVARFWTNATRVLQFLLKGL